MSKRYVGVLSVAIAAAIGLPVWASAKGGVKHPDVKALYAKNCAGCHGAKMQGGVGPALTREGKKRTYTWLVVELKNPKSHKKNSMMPTAAAEHLSVANVKAMAAYLSKLK
ncbi:MAG TPA: cytochrome c [Armatimonadota bacterium]|nr:cytochrome c [Armatimonadota bacterium]